VHDALTRWTRWIIVGCVIVGLAFAALKFLPLLKPL